MEKIRDRQMDKIAVLIPCYNESKTIAKVVAIQSFFTGLTLKTMVQKNKQDFEANLIRCNAIYRDNKN